MNSPMDALIVVVLMISALPCEGLMLSTEFFFGNTMLNWSEAHDYCNYHNGGLIMLNSMKKWKDYYLAMNSSEKCSLFYWTGLRLDPYQCHSDGGWSYDGWAKWDDENGRDEPKTCPTNKCVIVSCDGMRTRQCRRQNKVLCGKNVDVTTTKGTPIEKVTSGFWTMPQSSHSVGVTSDARTTTQSTQSAVSTTGAPNMFTDVLPSPYNTSLVVDGSCEECCFKTNKSGQLSHEELTNAIRELKSQLAINKNNLSVFRRKLISVYDSRPSSVAMGGVAVAILIVFLSVIVVPDIVHLVRFLYKSQKEHVL